MFPITSSREPCKQKSRHYHANIKAIKQMSEKKYFQNHGKKLEFGLAMRKFEKNPKQKFDTHRIYSALFL